MQCLMKLEISQSVGFSKGDLLYITFRNTQQIKERCIFESLGVLSSSFDHPVAIFMFGLLYTNMLFHQCQS